MGDGAGDTKSPEGSLPCFGDFQILRRLGRGGMGIVYEATQRSLDRRVAFKMLPPGLVSDPMARARFEREARAAARLHHPNIVEIYSTGIQEEIPYYAMEYVEGATLRDLLRAGRAGGDGEESGASALPSSLSLTAIALSALLRGSSEGQGLELETSTSLVKDAGRSEEDRVTDSGSTASCREDFRQLARGFAAVADGLQHAHSLGIVHRDVKPSNLILDPGTERGDLLPGRLRLLDFGLAWIEGQEHLTLAEEAVGTPAYMSPEQAQSGPHEVGPPTDVYGLGATIYEVLTGHTPFQGRNVHQTLLQILTRDPQPIREQNPLVPRDLETIVLKCLRKSPRERYASAEALAQDLRRFSRGDPIEARHYTRYEMLARRAWRNRGKIGVSSAMAILLIAMGWFGLDVLNHLRVLREASFREHMVEAATLLHEAFAPTEGPPSARQGRYSSQGIFVPAGMFLTDSRDFGAALRKASDDPVQRAFSLLERAESLIPGSPDAGYYRARLLARQGRGDDALRVIDSLLGRHPAFVPGWILKAAVCEELGKGFEATSATGRALQARGDAWTSAWLTAHIAMGEGRWREAASAFEELVDLEEPGREPYVASSLDRFLGHGVALLELGEYSRAFRAFARAEGRWPETPAPTLLLGRAQVLAGDLEDARSTFDRLHRRRHDAGDEIALRVAEIYCSLERVDEAVEWTGRIQDDGLRKRCEAPILLRRGEAKEALQAAEGAIEARPGDSLAHLWKGLALLAGAASPEGHADERGAEACFREAKRLDAGNAMARVWLGDLLAKRGELQGALGEYAAAMRIDPGNAWARISHGVTLERQNDHAGALSSFLAALELEPELTAAYQHIDGILRRDDRPDLRPFHDRFIRALRRVLSSRQDNPLQPDLLRIVSLSLSESPEPEHHALAITYARSAAARTPQRAPRMLAALAKALATSDDIPNAVLTLEDVVLLPGATREHLKSLTDCRALVPTPVSCASVDAALADADVEVVIPEGAVWRYFPGQDEPDSDDAAWYEPHFDAGAWPTGPSGFGYADHDDRTELHDMQNEYTTVYIRSSFTVENPRDGSRFVLSVQADDGFVAYLNGVEVGRHGVKPERGRLAHDATSDATVSVEPPLFIDVTLPTRLLQAGRNVLALQGLNATIDSSDLSLIPVLCRHRIPDPERDARVARALSGDPDARRLPMAYLEARVLQRAGRWLQAAERFREVVVLAGSPRRPSVEPAGVSSRPELLPALRLVECLRSAGQNREGEASALRALSGVSDSRPAAPARALWELWLSIVLDDLRSSPEEALERLPEPSGSDVAWLLRRLANGEPLRIQVGGDDYTDSQGRDWGRDRFYTGGCRFGEQPWSPVTDGGSPHYGGEIADTEDDLLYQTERWFPAEQIPPTGYRIPLPAGRYRVSLHFAEIYCRQQGLRAFDVEIEGKPELRWYEPPVTSPPSPAVECREVEVHDGALDIEFVPEVEFPKLSALEIERLSASTNVQDS